MLVTDREYHTQAEHTRSKRNEKQMGEEWSELAVH